MDVTPPAGRQGDVVEDNGWYLPRSTSSAIRLGDRRLWQQPVRRATSLFL